MRYLFGAYELDVEAYELRQDGLVVPTQPKVFDLIRHLVQHRDRVVLKNELLEAVWPGEFVSDSALSWSMSQARKALGQKRGAKVPIETIYGRGYRFAADVREVADPVASAAPSAPSAPSQVPQAPPRSVVPPAAAVDAEPFVGREALMRELGQALSAAQAGRGSLLLLTGEPGIGKSRCAQELAVEARLRSLSVWSGRCFAGDGAPALWPWVQVLRDAVASEEGGPLQARASELLAELGPAAAEAGDGAGVGEGEASPDRFWLYDRVTRFLADAGEQTPRLLLFDDLQRADAASLGLLSLLAQELPFTRVLVVGTARDPGGGDDGIELQRLMRSARQLPLTGLSADEVARYVERISDGAATPAMAQALHGKTAGNPLFMQETVRLLLGTRSPRVVWSAAASEIELPESAREVLSGRLDALEAEVRELVELASVLGTSFELALLERVHGREAPGSTVALLDRAVAARVLAPQPEPGRYRFAHDLLRELVYEALPLTRRVALHLGVAEALEQGAFGEQTVAELAHHYHHALPSADADVVLRATRRAGTAAARLGSHKEAARCLRWALDAQQYQPAPDPRMRAELLLELGTHLRASGDVRSSRKELEVAVAVAKEYGYADLLAMAGRRLRPSVTVAMMPDAVALDALEAARALVGDDDPRVRADVLGQLACIPPHALSMERSKALSGEALELARGLSDDNRLFDALRARLYSLSGPDDIEALLATTDEMRSLARGRTVAMMLSEIQVNRFNALLHAGEMEEADRALEMLGRAAADMRQAEIQWQHERMVVMRMLHRGEFESAERSFAQLERRAQRLGLGYGRLFHGPIVETLLRERGSLSYLQRRPAEEGGEADALTRTSWTVPGYRPGATREGVGRRENLLRSRLEPVAREGFARVPKNQTYLWTLCQSARAVMALDEPAWVEALLERLEPYPDHNAIDPFASSLGAVASYAGLLARRAGKLARAIELLEHGAARNAETGQQPQVARSRYALAKALLSGERKKRAAAREQLRQANDIAQRLGMQPLTVKIATLSQTL